MGALSLKQRTQWRPQRCDVGHSGATSLTLRTQWEPHRSTVEHSGDGIALRLQWGPHRSDIAHIAQPSDKVEPHRSTIRHNGDHTAQPSDTVGPHRSIGECRIDQSMPEPTRPSPCTALPVTVLGLLMLYVFVSKNVINLRIIVFYSWCKHDGTRTVPYDNDRRAYLIQDGCTVTENNDGDDKAYRKLFGIPQRFTWNISEIMRSACSKIEQAT